MTRSSEELLRGALTHFDLAIGYAHAEALDQMTIDAICLRLASGIEVLARLEPTVRENLFGQDWTLMWGMRNRITHGYLLIDHETVSETVERDLPQIVGRLRGALGIDGDVRDSPDAGVVRGRRTRGLGGGYRDGEDSA